MSIPTPGEFFAALFEPGGRQADTGQIVIGPGASAEADVSIGPAGQPEAEVEISL